MLIKEYCSVCNKETLRQTEPCDCQKIENACKWKLFDVGSMGVHDFEYMTECGKSYNSTKLSPGNYCQNCGRKVIF